MALWPLLKQSKRDPGTQILPWKEVGKDTALVQGELWVPAVLLWWSYLSFDVCNFSGLVPVLELDWGTKEATRSMLGPDCHLAPQGKGCTKLLSRG